MALGLPDFLFILKMKINSGGRGLKLISNIVSILISRALLDLKLYKFFKDRFYGKFFILYWLINYLENTFLAPKFGRKYPSSKNWIKKVENLPECPKINLIR